MSRKPWADRGSRHERGYGSRWDRLRKAVLRRDSYLCQECLRNGRLTPLCVEPYDHAVDHITPKSKGGGDEMDNLQALCTECHNRKTDQDEGRRRPRKVGLDGYPMQGRNI